MSCISGNKKLVGGLICLFAVVTIGAPAALAQGSDVFAGKVVYETHCLACHGPEGEALVAGTPYFSRGEGLMAADVTLIGAIKSGGNLMPGFDRIISDTEILDVVAYIRTLWQ